MNSHEKVFGKYEDDSGENYYCPIDEVADNTIVSEWEIDNCVETSTTERYSGNLNIVDKSVPKSK
jgi:hypothetical protein